MESNSLMTQWKKNATLFLAGQTVSIFGTSLVQYAILWHITLETKSGVMMMVSVIAGFLPTFFLAPFAGVWADRFDRKRLTAIEIAFSVGMLIGGIVIASWGGFKNRTLSMAVATLLLGLFTIGLGLVPVFWIYIGLMVVTGVVIPLFNTPATVLIQETVDPSYMGRVFGVMAMIYSSMMPLGMLVFGPLADIVAIEWLLILTGTLIILQGFTLLGSKVLMAAGVSKV